MAISSKLPIALISVVCLTQAAELKFTTEQSRIAAGESATLNWEDAPGQKTVILGKGDVERSGSMKVAPQSTSSYTLVSEGPSGFNAKTVTIEVEGLRGTDFPSNEDQFGYPLSGQRGVRSKGEFLQETFNLLQNDLSFSVRTFTVEGGTVVFLTNSSERGDLIGADERRRIRARRISFRLEVADRPGQLAYTIKSLIESQLRAEETWRKEGREDLYQRKNKELLARLSSLP
jgi:hypothetical protein